MGPSDATADDQIITIDPKRRIGIKKTLVRQKATGIITIDTKRRIGRRRVVVEQVLPERTEIA